MPCNHICEILSFNDYIPGEAIDAYDATAGEAYAEICAALPETLPGRLACAVSGAVIPIRWICTDFTGEAGTHTFRAELANEHCTYSATDDPLTENIDESELPFILVIVPAAPTYNSYTISDDTNTVSVTGPLPKDARLEARALAEDELAAYVDESVNVVFAYDIKIMAPGESGEIEYQPTAKNPVTVTIIPFTPIEAPVVEIVHISENALTSETITQPVADVAPAEDGTVVFAAEGFSIYIGTTPPALLNVSELYYNGSGFFTDEACSADKQVTDGTAPITDIQTLLNNVASNVTIYMKAGYTVSDSESWNGGTVYDVTIKRHSSYTGALVAVSAGAELTLANITVDGGAVWTGDIDPVLGRGTTNDGAQANTAAVSVDGALTLASGAVVQNNDNRATQGGGVIVNAANTANLNAQLNISGGSVCNNRSFSSSNSGSGVYCYASATINFTSGSIHGNCTGETGTLGGGGGMVVWGVLNMSGGTISGNKAAHGGGINGINDIHISGGVIENNKAEINGGGLIIAGMRNEISGGVIRNNTSANGGGIASYGEDYSVDLVISGGLITGNTAASYGGGVRASSGVADAEKDRTAALTVTGGRIIGNAATTGADVDIHSRGQLCAITVTGGSVQSIVSTATNNGTTSIANGAGHAATLHTLTLVNNTSGTTPVAADTAISALTHSAGYDYGLNGVKTDGDGKLYIWLPDGAAATGVITENAVFSGMSVSGVDTIFYTTLGYRFVNGSIETGGDGTTAENAFKTLGEALANADGQTIVVCGLTEIAAQQDIGGDVTLTSVYNNTDYRATNGAMLKRGAGYTGALLHVAGTLTLQNVTVDGGAVWDTPQEPSTRTNSGVRAAASMLWILADGTLNLMGGAVLQNNDTTGADPCHGGAINCAGAVNMYGGEISYHTTKSYGGAVMFNGSDIVFNVHGGSLEYNEAKGGWGGAFFIGDGTLNVSGGSISNNHAAESGGAVYQGAGTVNMSGGSMSGNVAAYGGAVVVYSFGSGVGTGSTSIFNMTGGSISGNRGALIGGGLCLDFNSYTGRIKANISGGSITGNTSASGSAVGFFHKGTIKNSNPQSTLTITGGTLSGAATDGSSIFADHGNVVLGSAIDIKNSIRLKTDLATPIMISVAQGGFTTATPLLVDMPEGGAGSVVVDYTSDITAIAAAEIAKFQLVQPGMELALGGGGNTNRLVLTALSKVYLNGQSGDDERDGSTPALAIKTLKKAYEKLSTVGGVIYICGEVTASGNVALSGAEYSDGVNTVAVTDGPVSIWRYSKPTAQTAWAGSYTGTLINVASGSSLTLSDIELNGHRYATGDSPAVTATAPMIKVESEATLNINNGARLQNNHNSSDYYGGAANVHGRLTMSGGSVFGNDAKLGGGVYIAAGGTGVFSGGSISNNSATNNGGGIYCSEGVLELCGATVAENTAAVGGGLCNSGYATISGGKIKDNATIDTGLGTSTSYNGGGIYNGTLGTLVITGGEISGNTALQYGGGISNGGTVRLEGGAITGNTASGFAGGGMLNAGTLEILGGEISGNSAKVNGGGVANSKDILMKGGVISGNSATNNGGGISNSRTLRLEGGVISGNETAGQGGGILNSGTLELVVGDIQQNTAAYGGGVYGSTANNTFTMSGGTISGNEASARGGGVYQQAGSFTMSGGAISQNTAALSGGGVDGSCVFNMTGGKISENRTSGGSGGGVNTSNTFNLSGGTITGNTASSDGGGVYGNGGVINMTGGTIYDNTALSRGGGVTLRQNCVFTLENGTIIDNKANNGGGVFLDRGYNANNATFNMRGGTIADNTAIVNGGGVYMVTYNNITDVDIYFNLSGGTVTGNTASANGGGVYMYGCGSLELSGGTITDNTAQSGGGMYVDTTGALGSATLSGGTISGNTASFNGGGVYVNNSTVTMNEGAVSNNMATQHGGGVYMANGTFNMDGGTIANNTASATSNGGGGGVYMSTGAFTMMNGEISNNEANGDNGGGVYVLTGTFTMQNGTITGNSTVKSGGGVMVTNAEALFVMDGGTIYDNTATGGGSSGNGGGIAAHSGKIRMSGGSIFGNRAAEVGNGIGVYYKSDGTSLTLSGSPNIMDDVGFTSGSDTEYINVDTSAGTFNPVAPIPVTSQTTTTGKVIVKYSSAAVDASQFYMTDPGLSLALSNDQLVLGNTTAVRYVANNLSLGNGLTPDSPCNLENAYRDLTNGGTIYIVETLEVNDTLSLSSTSWSISEATRIAIANGAVNIRRYSKPSATIAGYSKESLTGALFNVTGGANFYLSHITVDGHRYESTSTDERYDCPGVTAVAPLVHVASGTLYLQGGALLVNNHNSSRGGGVTVAGGSSTLAISGGAISGNQGLLGGGVYTVGDAYVIGGSDDYSATLTMSGGTISGNTATTTSPVDGGGGVCLTVNSVFTMSGGTISGNTAAGYGKGVCTDYSTTVRLSGAVTISDELHIAKNVSVSVTDELTGGPISLTLEDVTLGRRVAQYYQGVLPNTTDFSVSVAPYTTEVNDVYVEIALPTLQGTVTAAGEGVALGAGQSKAYTMPLSKLFEPGKTISITGITANGVTHEAYNTVYQNRRNYGYTKSNSTFGLSITKTGGAETDTLGGSASLGTMAANDSLTFTVYNANAITEHTQAGTITVTLSDGTYSFPVEITINRRSNAQLSVTVPMQITSSMNANTGEFTFPDADSYAIENYSNVPIEITSMSWVWDANNTNLFVDPTKLKASIRLGASQAGYLFNAGNLINSPGSDGRIIAYNGIVPGRLPLHWGLELGTGNAIKTYPGNGVSITLAKVTYTIHVAKEEFAYE